MKILEAIKNINSIHFPKDSPQVVETSASEFIRIIPEIEIKANQVPLFETAGIFNIAISAPNLLKSLKIEQHKNNQKEFIYFKIQENGSGWLICSHTHFLFSFVNYLIDYLGDQDISDYKKGIVITPAFSWQRISYDYFLNQEGRIQRNLKRDTYIKELAQLGFTHIEINGLGFPMALEVGPKGETYPMFYTYCPALDQFVFSSLNKGLYPYYYLSTNLNYLKENARLARKYGLTPGLLCFEPRSVPEEFFHKYPMLRGARADHPFRSFKPRYNMTITHPKVREHYAEMMQKLMKEVPELGFIAIWTNDSGSGFEHTKSLYVGRNGGAYLIREWKDDAEIARLAGENALRFFRLLRDAASEINPEFRVITRMESFYGEHETVWNGLGNRLDIETTSLLSKGWDMPYTHPKYPDTKEINGGTIYQQQFDEKEKLVITELNQKGANSHFYIAVGPHSMFEPLMGIPYPALTYKRLLTLHKNNIAYLAHCGGTFPAELVPYNINHEIVRQFQFNPELNIEKCISDLAKKWAGEKLYHHLIKVWELTENAILAFPNVSALYSTYGFAWYRLWARPFVPDLEAIPPHERNYYEDFICTTPHNPNNVDLSRDVLFQLTTPEKCSLIVTRIDQNLWQPLNEAIEMLNRIHEDAAHQLGTKNIIQDQLVRLKALRCWFLTQRNVAAWIAGVYGYLKAKNDAQKKQQKDFIKDMMMKEIENSKDLISLLQSNIEFMAMTDQGETPLIYGSNLSNLLVKRIELMQIHIDDEPYIDFNYIEKKAGELIR